MAYKATVLRVYPDALGASLLLGGQLRQTVDPGANVSSETVAGSFYPLFSAINSISPRLTFSTYDVAAALAAVGLLGLPIASTTVGRVGVELYELLYDDYGQLAAGAVHRRLRMRAGLLVPRRLSCSHQADASLDLELVPFSDGTNPPLEIEENVATPGTPTDAARHTLGTMSLGGVALTRIRSLSIEFGNSVNAQSAGSNPYATWIDIAEVRPVVSWETMNPEKFAAAGIPLTGKASAHVDTTIRLRKRVPQTAQFVADGTAQHIKITAAGVASCESAWDASANAESMARFRLNAQFDGTNAPLVIATTATLP